MGVSYILRIVLISGTMFACASSPLIARNARAILASTNGKAPLSWTRTGIQKFIKKYAGKWKYRVVSGGENRWKSYKGKSHLKVTKVTYLINGKKRNVAYVYGYVAPKTILSVVFNASPRQQSLRADIDRMLKNVK